MYFSRRTFAVLIGLCLLPLGAVLLSAALAALFGCELNEGVTNVCSIAGLDVGGFLSGLFVMGWLALITLPLLMCILALWALVEWGSWWRKKRRDRKSAMSSDTQI
jgi:hypothetical protein